MTDALINSTEELTAATKNTNVEHVVLKCNLDGVPAIRLMPGQTLRSGSDKSATLTFEHGDGLQLTSNNSVVGVGPRITPTNRVFPTFSSTTSAEQQSAI